jgi:hypothetical protein
LRPKPRALCSNGKSALRYTFHLVFVTSVQHTGGANGVVESLLLTYGSVEVESVP